MTIVRITVLIFLCLSGCTEERFAVANMPLDGGVPVIALDRGPAWNDTENTADGAALEPDASTEDADLEDAVPDGDATDASNDGETDDSTGDEGPGEDAGDDAADTDASEDDEEDDTPQENDE